MKLFALAFLVAAACGGPKTHSSPIVNEGSAVSDTCCCKSSPATSDDGKPLYEPNMNRMECSTKQGTCEADVQCNGSTEGDPAAAPAIAPGTGN